MSGYTIWRRAPLVALLWLVACRAVTPSTGTLPPPPANLDERLTSSLDAARRYPQHPWRDISPLNDDGTLNAYIEIPRGESTKWEFRIELNRREVDRMIPPELGGYPINYGFIPQTISYDGDPADVLVLGPPLPGGSIIKGRIVALMKMVDSGDLDSKVVISPLNARGAAAEKLEPTYRARLERFFSTYKNHEGKVTTVPGWDDEAAARTFVETTGGFFAHARR